MVWFFEPERVLIGLDLSNLDNPSRYGLRFTVKTRDGEDFSVFSDSGNEEEDLSFLQSVFTHPPPFHSAELFGRLDKAMNSNKTEVQKFIEQSFNKAYEKSFRQATPIKRQSIPVSIPYEFI